MTLPLHTPDPALLARAQRLLDERWLDDDADLAPVMPLVLARGVGQDWHKAGTFRHHLVGVARSLAIWQQPRDVRLLGLLHSVYGNAFVDLVKFDPKRDRGRLAEAIGERAESLVFQYCTASRRQFVERVLAGRIEPDGAVLLDEGACPRLEADVVAAFIVVSMADTIEQWTSWQDDVYSRFPAPNDHRPQAAHWMASLWPGPMRPSGRMLHQVNRLGLALQHPALRAQLPLPPVFDGCTRELSAADDAAAAALYWSVVQQDQPLVDLDVATAVMESAVRHDPWIGEPQMVLAQLYLSAGRRDDAERAAQGALQCLASWGNAWDKRVAWDAWIAWTRILLQSARDGDWPASLDRLNNMALRGPAAATMG